MNDHVTYLQNALEQGDPTVIGVIVAVGVVLLTLLILICKSRTNNRRGVLLVGLCDAGKTALYSKLVENRFVQTHTSMKENTGTYYVKGDKKASLKILDLPGHERLRSQFLEQYKQQARAYIFMIDSMTITKDIKDTAEYLFILLTDKTIQATRAQILVMCNKHDHTLAKGMKVVQGLLEKEITTLRVTQSAALESTSATGTNMAFIGKKGQNFQFSDLKANKVTFVEGSTKENKEADLRPLEEWLTNVA